MTSAVVLEKAKQMEEEGQKIIKLNIGNLAVFNFAPPDEIVQDMILNMQGAAGYTDSKACSPHVKRSCTTPKRRRFVASRLRTSILGNGASELIVMGMNALLNTGDEVLVPHQIILVDCGCQPVWGKPIHYVCDESADWMPDIEDIKRKITPKTKAIVAINPNNQQAPYIPLKFAKRSLT